MCSRKLLHNLHYSKRFFFFFFFVCIIYLFHDDLTCILDAGLKGNVKDLGKRLLSS
jgi:hypothetical protein